MNLSADDFTIQCAGVLLVALGYALWQTGRGARSMLQAVARTATAVAVDLAAFVLVGHAILQGAGDALLTIDRSMLYGRGIDGSAVFHAAATTVGIAIFAAGARAAPVWALALAAAAYGGLIAPVAMRQTWWSLLRSVGLIDTGGAIAIHLCGAAGAMALARMFADRRAAVAPAEAHERLRDARAALGALPLVAVGFALLARVTSVMQSPATVGEATVVLAMGAVAGAVVGLARRDVPSSITAVACSAIAGAAATGAGAGRMPWWLAILAGAAAAALAIPCARMLRGFFGSRIDAPLIGAHLAGGLVAVLAAVPCAIHAEPRVQIPIQLVAAFALAGLATCAAVVVLGAGKLMAEVVGLIAPRPREMRSKAAGDSDVRGSSDGL